MFTRGSVAAHNTTTESANNKKITYQCVVEVERQICIHIWDNKLQRTLLDR